MGSKVLALAGLGAAVFLATRPSLRPRPPGPAAPRRRVVVLGAGFGGLAAVERLRGRAGIDLTVIDTHNHHLFQPLLYQVATAALSPSDIASSLRGIVAPDAHTHVRRATVTGIDRDRRLVLCGEDGEVPFDALIIATGSRPSYFGHPDWERFAPGLKTLDDALHLRRLVLEAFEHASATPDAAERRRRLTFVLIGAGPTGVEMAGSIAELAHDTLPRDYDMDPGLARILILEEGDDVLSGFAPELRSYARRALEGMGVEIRTGCTVTDITAHKVDTDKGVVPNGCTVWTAGTEATPVAGWLGVAPGKGGRVEVGRDLMVPGLDGVFVIGDAALAKGVDGEPLPGLAPVAKQQGGFAAWSILRPKRARRFRYVDFGTLATIGRAKAVAEFGPVRLTGLTAWVTWAVAHIFFLIGFRNRVIVSAQWAFAYLTHERGSRLIVAAADAGGQAKKKAMPNRT